jgi:hypothetical protein
MGRCFNKDLVSFADDGTALAAPQLGDIPRKVLALTRRCGSTGCETRTVTILLCIAPEMVLERANKVGSVAAQSNRNARSECPTEGANSQDIGTQKQIGWRVEYLYR